MPSEFRGRKWNTRKQQSSAELPGGGRKAVKMHFLTELYEFNQAFDRVIATLKRMEKTGFTLPAIVRGWRAQVVSIQIEANRELLDQVEATLNDHERWARQVLRKYQKRQPNKRQLKTITSAGGNANGKA